MYLTVPLGFIEAIPLAGLDTDTTVSVSPSRSVSFNNTSISTSKSSSVEAISSNANGGLLGWSGYSGNEQSPAVVTACCDIQHLSPCNGSILKTPESSSTIDSCSTFPEPIREAQLGH